MVGVVVGEGGGADWRDCCDGGVVEQFLCESEGVRMVQVFELFGMFLIPTPSPLRWER